LRRKKTWAGKAKNLKVVQLKKGKDESKAYPGQNEEKTVRAIAQTGNVSSGGEV